MDQFEACFDKELDKMPKKPQKLAPMSTPQYEKAKAAVPDLDNLSADELREIINKSSK